MTSRTTTRGLLFALLAVLFVAAVMGVARHSGAAGISAGAFEAVRWLGPELARRVEHERTNVRPVRLDRVHVRGRRGPPAAALGPRWSVQLGAFKVAMNAEALRDRLALLLTSPEASGLPAELHTPRIERQAGLSRVLIGEATERAVALQWSRLLERYLARPTALFVR